MTLELTFPYPLSANKYWRIFQPKGFKAPLMITSKAAKNYKRALRSIVIASGLTTPIVGRVWLDIKLYPHRPLDWIKRAKSDPLSWDDTVQCLDLDNANKVLLDSLKGIAIEDDKWVRKLTSERMEPDGEARVVVRIEQIVAAPVVTPLFGPIERHLVITEPVPF